jgi:membrane protein implicated in regulation of membrane protease activity
MPPIPFTRRLAVLLPLAIVAALLVAPLTIFLLRDDRPAIVNDRLRATIVSVGTAVERERRLVVKLEDGLTVVIRSEKVPLEAKAGDGIQVLRSKLPSGEIGYDVEG